MDQVLPSARYSISIRGTILKGWGDDDLQQLLKMYENKCSLQVMAVHFQRTRGSISGAIFRARQKGLVGTVRATIDRPPPRPVLPKPPVNAGTLAAADRLLAPRAKKRRIRLKVIDDNNLVTFAELEPHHCRWPIGDPRQSDFRFCGCRRELGKPYCVDHALKAGRQYDKEPIRRMVIRPSYQRK